MCQANVYLRDGEQERLLMEDAASVAAEGQRVRLRDVLGEEKSIPARFGEADLVGHRIVLRPVRGFLPDHLADLIARAEPFHGHLGPFLVIGLRMGLLARRTLGFRGHFDARVTACTGARPPISCIADGLQFSTGATLGKGNIQVADLEAGRPAARIEARGRALEVAVTPSALDSIRSRLEHEGAEAAAEAVAAMADDELFVVESA